MELLQRGPGRSKNPRDLPNGLFKWKEYWSAPLAVEAFVVEVAIAVVLIVAGALCLAGSASASTTGVTPAGTST